MFRPIFPLAAVAALALGACSSAEDEGDRGTQIDVDGPTDAVIDFTLELAKRDDVYRVVGTGDGPGGAQASLQMVDGASGQDLVEVLRGATERGLSYEVGPVRLVAAN